MRYNITEGEEHIIMQCRKYNSEREISEWG